MQTRKDLREEARRLTESAAVIAMQQKGQWQARVTMRRWSDAALKHLYCTQFQSIGPHSHAKESKCTQSRPSEQEFAALFGICDHNVRREHDPLAVAYETQYPLESHFLVRLLVRLPEMATHLDSACIERFVQQSLLVEHVKQFAQCVFDCWDSESPHWYAEAVPRVFGNAAPCHWRHVLLQRVDRLFEAVQVPLQSA